MNPRPEFRISSLEKRTTAIEATIEELSSDQAESNKALFKHIQKGFDHAHAYIQENIATKQDISRVESELIAMEGRIKDDIASIKTTQEQILTLLQQKTGE